jgi:UPF0271 protein
VDLNADLGEGSAEDTALLPLITSANVACGFHAGDAVSIIATVRGCADHDVAIGAQVSYNDPAGFGRRPVDISYDDLRADVLTQLELLDGFCRVAGRRIRYVKPHGALYHRVRTDCDQAAAFVDAVIAFDPGLAVLTMPGGAVRALAFAADLRVVTEGFADRGYSPAGDLVPRGEPGALLTDCTAVAAQALRLSAGVDSLCIHSDTPGAAALAQAARDALLADGQSVAAWH